MRYLRPLPSALSVWLMFICMGLTGISQAGVPVRGNVYAQAVHEQMVSEANCIHVYYHDGEAGSASAFGDLAEWISQVVRFINIKMAFLKS